MKFLKNITSSKVYKSIFGYDIFISYSRMDSIGYAYSVSQHFLDKGYECYLDQLSSTTPGKELPPSIKNAAIKSSSFILVGSAGAKQSQAIENEIQVFLENNLNKPFIPITIDGEINETAIWFNKVQGLAFIEETTENLKFALPNKKVLERIESALKFTKKSKRLKTLALLTVLSVVFITGIAIIYTYYRVDRSTKEISEAKNLTLKQKEIADKAKEETKVAVIEKNRAESLKRILDEKADSLNIEIAKRNLRIEQSTALYSKQFKSAQEMSKEFDFAIDAVPFIKGYCSSKNLIINKGELLLFGKLDRTIINASNKDILVETIKDWLNSTNKPEINVDGYYAGYRIDEESLDLIMLTGKGTSAYNLAVSGKNSNDIVRFFINNGIPANKIVSRSYGDSKNLSKGVLFNNRVEIYTTP